MSDHIPPELITTILSRLSVKTLLQCRCVSKLWHSIIDSQELHNCHLSWSIETNSNSYIIANSRYLEIYSIKTDALDKAHKIESPIGRWYILGSCNGIILMGCSEREGKDKLALFNPATRARHFLPEDNAPFFTGFYTTRSYKEVFGFGYDSVRNDFKVVSILKIDSVCETNIFSLKTNSWKRIKDFPYKQPSLWRWGVHVNSALHAVVDQSPDHKCPKSMFALDLSLEDYRWMELPNISTEGVEFDVSKLGQCLCLCAYTNIKTDIWVMKEYGMARSWTKLLSVDLPGVSVYGSLKTLAYSKDGDKVLLHYNTCSKFIWYDLRSKQFNHVDMSNSSLDMLFNVGVCIESLVQLGTRERTKKRKERDDFLSVGFKLKL